MHHECSSGPPFLFPHSFHVRAFLYPSDDPSGSFWDKKNKELENGLYSLH